MADVWYLQMNLRSRERNSKSPMNSVCRYNSAMRVFILGAGMSGLATSERLAELGVDAIEVVDKEMFPGGLAKSFAWGGFDYNDLGPHIWHTPSLSLANEWKSRFGNLLFESRFYGQNVIGESPGTYYDYPLSQEMLKQLPRQIYERVRIELLDVTKEEVIKAKSFDEYVEALVGPTLKNLFFKSYPEKLWGIPTSKMTSNWAPKRIRFTQHSEEFHGAQWAAVGKKGSGALVNQLYLSAVSKGVKFHFGFDVKRIEREGNLVKAIVGQDGRKLTIQPEDKIVSTIPFNFVAKQLGLNNALGYRGALLVYLALNKSMAIPGRASFLYFPQQEIPFHRLSEQKKFCGHGWEPNITTLTAEIAFNENEIEGLNVDKKIQQCVESVVEYGLCNESQIRDITTRIAPCVYPILTRENEVDFQNINAKLKDFTQLYCIGTSGEFHYADLQILYQKGRDLAQRLLEEKSIALSNLDPKKDVSRGTFFSYFQDQKPFVIAEIGLNHGGSFEIAKEMLASAKDSGVKYVKFQTYFAESRVSKAYRSNNYSEEVLDTEESLFTMFKRLEFTRDEWKQLFLFAKDLGLLMFTAVFDIKSLRMMEEINCPAYKIASMDLNNYQLIEAISLTNKPVVMSTGMSSLGEIERSLQILRTQNISELIILHCVSSYPANANSLNLSAMGMLSQTFGVPVGFSDHSIGLEVPLVALSIGAVCVEKHFTLNNQAEGPDHIFSLEPAAMKELIRLSEEVPAMLGRPNQLRSPQERETAFRFKKSIHANHRLEVGSILTHSDISIKGPYGGISPEHLNIVIGRKVTKTIEEDFPITWDHI